MPKPKFEGSAIDTVIRPRAWSYERKIAFNGRYRAANMTGVQRYAAMLSERLQVRELVPGRLAGRRGGILSLWEQVVLPGILSDDDILISPANMGPVILRRQILAIHDVAPLVGPDWFNWLFAAWYRVAWRLLCAQCIAITTVSEFSRDEISKHLRIPKSRIAVIYNGCEHILNCTPKPIADVPSLAKKRFAFMLGSIQPRKNMRRVIAAWNDVRLRADVLVIVGTTAKVFAGNVPTDVAPNVVFLGRRSDNEIAWLYDTAEVFIAPSIYEGFDIPSVEALRRDCPVCASDIPVHHEVLGAAAKYFSATDVRQIADVLVEAMEVGRRGRAEFADEARIVCEKFSWEHAASTAIAVYDSAHTWWAGRVV